MKKGKSRRPKFKITYFDPSDPKGERIKTWRFRTRKAARYHQLGIKEACGEKDCRQFPIRKIKRKK